MILSSPVALLLVCVGQLLNVFVFKAIGQSGVYYGSQLGYSIPWCDGFPYNVGIGDPQYWGVLCTIWGIYLAAYNVRQEVPLNNESTIEHFAIPLLETFWYLMSMKLLEHENGKKVLKSAGLMKQQ